MIRPLVWTGGPSMTVVNRSLLGIRLQAPDLQIPIPWTPPVLVPSCVKDTVCLPMLITLINSVGQVQVSVSFTGLQL